LFLNAQKYLVKFPPSGFGNIVFTGQAHGAWMAAQSENMMSPTPVVDRTDG